MKTLPAVGLLVDGCHGIYVPQRFICNFKGWQGISQENHDILSTGPDAAYYWEAWDEVLDNASFTDGQNTWRLHQDGDLWTVCPELMTDEEKANLAMTIKIGTSHFVTEADARRYYKPLGRSIVDVREALEAGTIFLGPPTLGPNQTLSIEAGRYFIGVKEK